MGTAAYLDVFGSIYAVMKELKKQGYTVEDIPDSAEGRAIGVTVYLGEGAMSTYIDIQAK